MEKSFLQLKENQDGLKDDCVQFGDHILETYSMYIELQNKIKKLANFDLSGVEAKQELHTLIHNFENGSLVKIVRDLLNERRDVAVNRAGSMSKACADDQTENSFDKKDSNYKTIPSEDGKVLTDNGNIKSYGQSVGHAIALSAKSYTRCDPNLATTVFNAKVADEWCLRSLEIPAPGTEVSIAAVNDEIQSSFNCPRHFISIDQPFDHPVLPDAAVKNVMKIWELGKSGVMSQTHSLNFPPDVYASLKPGEKVVSEIINGYNDLIVKRSGKGGLPSVSAAEDYFLRYCKGFGIHGMPASDINLQADILLFPMYRSDHWYTCVVDMRPQYKHVKCYDSLYSSDPHYEALIMKELSYVTEFLSYLVAPVEWHYQLSIMKNAPQQKNYVDCGVFTCKASDYLATDEAPDFDQRDILYHRHQIVVELEAGKLSRRIQNGVLIDTA